jgi:excinuclease UvrABC nuclease subunit
LFFFEKKNQKTFPCWAVLTALPAPRKMATPRKRERSLFASFSSEKEDFVHSLMRGGDARD